MRKLLSLFISICLLLVCFSAQADYIIPNLPEPNTDKEIVFSGFDWYADFNTTINTLQSMGINKGSFHFDKKLGNNAVHWNEFFDIFSDHTKLGMFGGYVEIKENLPKVAGNTPYSLRLYFMWNPDSSTPPLKYDNEDAALFYMAVYTFENKAQFDDLLTKLKKIYGTPWKNLIDSSGDKVYDTYAWVNNENAVIGLSYGRILSDLMYMAPNAEELLYQVEEMVSGIKPERPNEDDFSGL